MREHQREGPLGSSYIKSGPLNELIYKTANKLNFWLVKFTTSVLEQIGIKAIEDTPFAE
jgi:hypothetical protein